MYDAANLAMASKQEDDTISYELIIACEALPKMDLLSLSDPMVVVYLLIDGEFKEVGKTEVIFDTLDP